MVKESVGGIYIGREGEIIVSEASFLVCPMGRMFAIYISGSLPCTVPRHNLHVAIR